MVRYVNCLLVHTFRYVPWVKHVDQIRMGLRHEAVHLFVSICRQARDTELTALQCLQAALQTEQLHRIK